MSKFEQIPTLNFKKDKKEEIEYFDLLKETYQSAEIMNKLDVQRKRGQRSRALFTDVDNTFFRIGKEKAMRTVEDRAEKMEVPIVAVTGNDFKNLYEKRIKTGELPYFDVIIGAVGTEIWSLHKDKSGKLSYKKDEYYDKLLKSGGFQREEMMMKSLEMINDLKEKWPEAKLDFQKPELEQQWLTEKSAEVQPYKISFHFFANEEEKVSEITDIASRNFPSQPIVVCEEINYNQNIALGDKNKKYNLDILPATKKDAIKYLSNLIGLEQGIVAGDSGNDIDMLLDEDKMVAVLVGGYKKEAKDAVERAIVRRKPGRRSFQKIVHPDGTVKVIYVEPESDKRQASESILRAAEILMRAKSIQEIRQRREV